MSTRLGLALGFALASVLGAWWLAASRLAIGVGSDAGLVSVQVLFALALLRSMLVALAGPRAAAVGGYVAGLRVCLPVVTVAWPLVAVAWLASFVPLSRALLVELALLGATAAVPFAGRALARIVKQGPLLESLASVVGVLLALAAAWAVGAALPAG
jgi:hypothetical protein